MKLAVVVLPPSIRAMKGACMKAFFSLVLVLVMPSVVGAAPGLEETYAAQGRLVLAPFASAPFPHPAQAEGNTCQNNLYARVEHCQP